MNAAKWSRESAQAGVKISGYFYYYGFDV